MVDWRGQSIASVVPFRDGQRSPDESWVAATGSLGPGPTANDPRPQPLREPALPALQGLPHPSDLADNVQSLPPDRC